MFRSGAFLAGEFGDLRETQVQPNGVDLTLGAVYEQVEPGRIGRDGKTVGERTELEPVGAGGADGDGTDSDGGAIADESAVYRLSPGGYVVQYAEHITIPEEHVGFLYPRSSLLRNSCMLDTAVWDAGYEGRGQGLLEVYHDIEIEAGARIAQLVLASAEHEDTYDGSYQHENL